MKSLVKSISLLTHNNKYVVQIITKSDKIIEYDFSTYRSAELYYKDIIMS